MPVLTIALLLLNLACGQRPPASEADYVARIAAERAAKDAAFERGSDSPIPENRRHDLLPLAYFSIDPAYDIPAVLRPASDGLVVQMPTSTGTMRQMRRVGTLEFTLKGRPMKLTAFVEVGAPNMNRLFVPFSDMTSGTETYAAGRYLDLDRNATGIYIVDFNTAYHPYCYYNPTWECPYPPAENRLKIPIHAGERMRKEPT